MLDKPINKIVTDENGKFMGVQSGGEVVKAKQVIGDPSYFGAGATDLPDGKVRVIETGKVVRAICFLKHPIPGTDKSDSAQIIIPQNQVGRRNGELQKSRLRCLLFNTSQIFTLLWSLRRTMSVLRTYMLQLLAPLLKPTNQNLKLRLVSSYWAPFTTSKYLVCELSQRNHLSLSLNRFVSITPLYSPTTTGVDDNIFITQSYDATSHFETVVEDVQGVWKRVVGSELVLKKREVEVQA